MTITWQTSHLPWRIGDSVVQGCDHTFCFSSIQFGYGIITLLFSKDIFAHSISPSTIPLFASLNFPGPVPTHSRPQNLNISIATHGEAIRSFGVDTAIDCMLAGRAPQLTTRPQSDEKTLYEVKRRSLHSTGPCKRANCSTFAAL